MVMESFISWIGGKKALRRKIVEEFPEKGTYSRYVEVFGGAGWVLFFLEKHARMEVYNDINGNLVNLFRCVKYHSDAVRQELQYILMSREQFFDAVEQAETRGMTDIQRAARFFILIKESFGTDLSSFGVRPRNFEKAKEYLDEVARRLDRVVIERLDFQHVLKTYDREDALFYLDPPYYETEKYYGDRFAPEDHERLKTALDSVRGRFVLSYNDCKYIRNLYRDYTVIEVDRPHNLVKKEVKPRYRELIIKNYI